MKPYVFDFLDDRKDGFWQVIRSTRYALILKLINGHGKVQQTTESHVCLNCDTQFVGNYCPNCGQDSRTEKLTVKHIFTNFFSGFLNVDNGFLNTILCLFYRPGYMINDYLKGKRVNYFKPFQTLFVLATLYLILAHFLDPNAFTPQTSQADTSEINVIDHERSFSLDDQHFLKKTYRAVKDLIGGNKAFVLLGIIPFMTFGYYYAFKKKSIPVRLNGTETFFAQVYYSCQFLLVSLISLLITRQSQVYSPVDFSFKLFLIIQIWNNHQLYHISFIRSFKRTLIAIIYAFLFAIALITCFVLILRLFYSI